MKLRSILLAAVFLLLGCTGIHAADTATSRWIVVYKSHALKAAAVGRRAGKTRRDFRIIPALAADLTAGELDEIRKDPSVAVVEPDCIRHTCLPATVVAADSYQLSSLLGQFVPYGIDLVHARDAWPFTKGAGVRVADIDTGIDLSHPDRPTIIASATFTSMPVQDSNGHGTHTAGTMAAPDNGIGVAGVAPEAGLLVAQVFNSNGYAYDSDIIAGIDWAVANGAKVINMSLGGSTYNSATDQACANAVASGVVVVAAAGNDNSGAPFYPAAYSSVISVAAVDQYKQRALFSNYGSTISLCAPGVAVFSTVPVGTGALCSANWNAIDRVATTMDGSANGIVTADALYCGLGNPWEFPAGIAGKIAHIRRGTLTFAVKVANAVAAGAIGVIISNNNPGTINGTLNGSTTVPVVAVSQADGNDLQANDGILATIAFQSPADYASYDGTSMAAPHVSGVAALLVAARHGNITPAEVRSAMQTSAQDLGAAGRDNYYGYGLVNAGAALAKVVPIIQSVAESPAVVARGDTVTVTVGLSISTGVSSVTANGVVLSASGGVWTGNPAADPTPGIHAVNVVLTDIWGNTTSNNTAAYRTVPVVAATGRSLSDQLTNAVLNDYMFTVCGKASQVTANSFVVSDGSGYPVTINAPGHSATANRFVQATGLLQKGPGGLTIQSSAAKVLVIQ